MEAKQYQPFISLQPRESAIVPVHKHQSEEDGQDTTCEVGEAVRYDTTQTGALLFTRVHTGGKCLIYFFGIAGGVCVDTPLAAAAISLGTVVSVPVAQQRRTCVAVPVTAQ